MSSHRVLRIGTRRSALAMHQSLAVQEALRQTGTESTLVEIDAEGDQDAVTPLYEMGIQGVFTRSLDQALLNNRIDIAVHSLKDVPTRLAHGLVHCGTMERESAFDCLVLHPSNGKPDYERPMTVATSSLRRKLQWAYRYPLHGSENLRGNIHTRLGKLDASDWSGILMAHAALIRLGITSHQFEPLTWMVPAPAQGAVGIVCRGDDVPAQALCCKISHTPTETCVRAERTFMAALHGGCAMPIAAHACFDGEVMRFEGNVVSYDGREMCTVREEFVPGMFEHAGRQAAEKILASGARDIINTYPAERNISDD